MTPASILKHRGDQPQVAPVAGSMPSIAYRRQEHPRRRAAGDENDSAFYGFLRGLFRLWLFPITFPLRKMYQMATSPLTISLTVKSILLATLLLASGILSTLSVATFWFTWGRTGSVEVEGWLIYGSKMNPTPHTQITFVPAKLFPQDVPYDVEVELELLRPRVGSDNLGSFMITMDLISERSGDPIVTISQPCLPALPYIPPGIFSRLISIPLAFSPLNLYSAIPIPRIRSANPLKLFGILSRPKRSRRSRKASKDRFLLVRPMTNHEDGLVLRPSGRKFASKVVGGVKLVVGREDGAGGLQGEVKTGGWVIVRFTPRATGLKWLMTSHWSIPAMILPPIAFGLTLSSALASFLVISLFFKPAKHIPAAKLAPLASTTRKLPGQDGKKIDNDPLGRRSVSFVDSRAAQSMDTGRGGLVLRASGREDGNVHVRPVPQSETITEEAAVAGLPTPSTPVKRTPGQSGGKIAQKSPAPSVMLQRKGSGGGDATSDDDDHGMKESLELQNETFESSTTETGTESETETDRGT